MPGRAALQRTFWSLDALQVMLTLTCLLPMNAVGLGSCPLRKTDSSSNPMIDELLQLVNALT